MLLLRPVDVVERCMVGRQAVCTSMIKFQSLVGLCPCAMIFPIVSKLLLPCLVMQEGRRELEMGNFLSSVSDKAMIKSSVLEYWLYLW